MAGVRLPVRTHPLHAFVTNDYAQGFPIVLASTELACYVSQTERGQMLIGAEFDASRRTRASRRSRPCARYSYKITRLLPFLREMRILRTWAGHLRHLGRLQPDHGRDARSTASYVTTGWGTWGFKAIPAGGEGMAELIATGRPPALIAPFALDRFARDHVLADAGLGGDPLMPGSTARAAGAGRSTSSCSAASAGPRHRRSRTPTRATSTRSGSSRTPTARRPSAGSTRSAAGAG